MPKSLLKNYQAFRELKGLTINKLFGNTNADIGINQPLTMGRPQRAAI